MHRDDPRPSGGPEHQSVPGSDRRLLTEQALVFALAAGLLAFLALDGAAYDLEVRQGVGLGVWAVIALGFGVGILPRSRPPRILLLPMIGTVALIAWMAISLTWTSSAERTTAELARVLTYSGLVTLAISGLHRGTFRAAAGGLSAAVLGIAALAVATRLAPSLIPSAAGLGGGFHIDRLSYPLDYWNAVGIWGAMGLAIGVAWSAHARHTIVRALSLAAVPVAGLAVYLSYSRGAVVGAAVAVVTVLALSRNRWTAFVHAIIAAGGIALAVAAVRSHDEIANATGSAGGAAVLFTLEIAAVLCVGIVLVTSLFDSDRVRLPRPTANWAVPSFLCIALIVGIVLGHAPASRAWHQFKDQDQPTSGTDPAARLASGGGTRTHLWDAALDAFDAHPLEGVGPGTFEFWWTQHGDEGEFVRDAHSLYLEQMAELGLPGMLLLLVCLGGLLAAALLARADLSDDADVGAGAGLLAAFLVFCVSAGGDWLWEETAVGALALMGVAVAAAGGSRRVGGAGAGPVPPVAVRAAVVLIALASAAFEVPGLVSTNRVRASERALQAGELRNAKKLADQAVSAEPWAASSHLQLGIVLGRQGHLAAARHNVRIAQHKEPTNWRIPLVLAPIEAKLGHRRGAVRAHRRAHRLWPLRSPYNR